MNLVQLEYLATTERTGSFSAAARELFVTPQTVSKALGALEVELGVPLFARSGRQIALTDEGRLLADRARDVLADADDLRGVASRLRTSHAGASGRLAVAVASEPIRGQLVPDAFTEAFRAAHPDVELVCLANASEACLDAVRYGIADAAVTLGYTTRPGLSWTRLYSFTFYLTLAPGNPLAVCPRIRMEDLSDVPVATPTDFRCSYRIIKERGEEHGIRIRYVDVPATMEAHRAFLEDGGAIFTSAHPQLIEAYPELAVRPFEPGEGVSIPVCLVWREDDRNPALSLLERCLTREGRRARLQ